jgi:RNA recognition motif-containing protein
MGGARHATKQESNGMKLYVGNLSYETSEDQLRELFSTAGSVESVQVMRDRETGRARGFAFVEMTNDADGQNAIAQLNERGFGGRTLTVNEARPQAPRGSFGGARGDHARRRSEPRW